MLKLVGLYRGEPLRIFLSRPNKDNREVEVEERVEEGMQLIEEYAKRYKVIIHNDHFTSMDFVIQILMDVFDKGYEEAYRLMMYVHKNGQAVAGLYSKEIAENKIRVVKDLAEENEFPLFLTMERVV